MSSKVDRLRSSSISSSFDAILSLKNRSFSATLFASSFTSSSFDDDAFYEKRRRAVVRRRVVAIDDSCQSSGDAERESDFIIVSLFGAVQMCGTDVQLKM